MWHCFKFPLPWSSANTQNVYVHVWLTWAAVMWLQGRWAQDCPSALLIGSRQVGCISSIVPGWGHWLAIHKIEFTTLRMINFGLCFAANGPLFVPRIAFISLHCQYAELLLFAGMLEQLGKQKPTLLLIEHLRETVESELCETGCRYKEIPPRQEREEERRKERGRKWHIGERNWQQIDLLCRKKRFTNVVPS